MPSNDHSMTWTDYDQARFDAGLDAWQAQQAEWAHEAAERSYETAARPDALPLDVTFGDLRVGDYMTNEGPHGRWVKVVEIRDSRHPRVKNGDVSVLFELVESVSVSGETRYWIDRAVGEPITVDARVRAAA